MTCVNAVGTSYAFGILSTTDNIIGWCGYIFNPEMPDDGGAYPVRYRWYLPGLGRWMKRDPLRYIETMNLYEAFLSRPHLE